MAGRADDDLPKRATATGDGGRRAATSSPSSGREEEDERTVRKPLDADVRNVAARVSGGNVVPAPGMAGPLRTAPIAAAGGRTMPRRPTVVGLAPPPATRADPRPQPPPGTVQADAGDGTITTAAPLATVTSALPLTVPGNVQIREVEEPLEETEVKTLVADPSTASDAEKADKLPVSDASITRLAPPIARAPNVQPGVLPTLEADDTYVGDAYISEESVTSREAARGFADDRSVTALAKVPAGAPKPRREGTDSEEVESVTKRAPGHLTNMLRVIATPDDELPEDNQTAVMANAPVKPITEADSGLQMAVPDAISGERASVGALIAGTPAVLPVSPPMSPPMLPELHAHEVARASFPSAEGMHVPPPIHHPLPSHHAIEPALMPVKKPRYGLLVGLVAALSFAIPLALFLLLHRSSGVIVHRTASEVVPDMVVRADEKRTKAPKAPTSAAPTQRSNQGGRGGKRGR